MRTIGRGRIYPMLILALILQITILKYIGIFGLEPDLMIILVVFFGLFLGPLKGFEIGLAAGLLKDLFALDFLGINMVVMGLTGLFAGLLGVQFSRDSKGTQFLLVLIFNAFSMILHYVIASFFSKYLALGFGEYLAASVIPVSIYTALISIPVFFKCTSMYRIQGSEDYL